MHLRITLPDGRSCPNDKLGLPSRKKQVIMVGLNHGLGWKLGNE